MERDHLEDHHLEPFILPILGVHLLTIRSQHRQGGGRISLGQVHPGLANGEGVRFLTEYAQYSAPANNHELIYEFQGLTSDGAYYVIAILPVTNPFMAETSDPGAPIPQNGGVPYPDINDPNANWPLYYKSVTDVLGATPENEFTPALNQLDLLVQSIQAAP